MRAMRIVLPLLVVKLQLTTPPTAVDVDWYVTWPMLIQTVRYKPKVMFVESALVLQDMVVAITT